MLKHPKIETAKQMLSIIKRHKREAFLVGGCIRNYLLKQPLQDIDIVTTASFQELLTWFPQGKIVGRDHPVVLVKQNDTTYEVSTCRATEAATTPEWLKQDALKRDFTINAIYYDPFEEKILDYTDGQQDLERKMIRFNHAAPDRIEEDPHRMLRAIRLAAEYHFEIEPDSFQAIIQYAHKIKSIAAERLWAELEKIWMLTNAEQGLRLLQKSRLLRQVLPEVDAQIGIAQPLALHPEGDCFEHTCSCMASLPRPASRRLVWAALLHDIGKPITQVITDKINFPEHEQVGSRMAFDVLTRLKSDHELRRQVSEMIEHHSRFGKIDHMKKSELKRIIGRETFQDELVLYEVDKMSGNKDLTKVEKVRAMAEVFLKDQHTLENAFKLINGHDLKSNGLVPGPAYQVILKTIHDAYLDHEINTREQALAMARKSIKSFHDSRKS